MYVQGEYTSDVKLLTVLRIFSNSDIHINLPLNS